MAIPKFDELLPDLVAYVIELGPVAWRELEAPVGKVFTLTADEFAQEYGIFRSD